MSPNDKFDFYVVEPIGHANFTPDPMPQLQAICSLCLTSYTAPTGQYLMDLIRDHKCNQRILAAPVRKNV